jgi:hypothetical protein
MGRFLKHKQFKSAGYTMALPSSTTALRPSAPVPGEIRFNIDTNQVEAYFTSNSTPGWYSLAHTGAVTIKKDTFTGDGVNSGFTIVNGGPYYFGQEAQVIVVVGNIFQNPGVAYTFGGSGYALNFATPPPLGQTVIVLHGYAGTNAA